MSKEYALRNLPAEFSKDPTRQDDQIWQAIETGYYHLDKRFGRFASRRWVPNRDNIKIIHDPLAYLEAISYSCDEFDLENSRGENHSHARSVYEDEMTYINTATIKAPITMLVVATHETIHQWAGKLPIRFKSFDNDPEVTKTINESFSSSANEFLVDYVALVALDFLREIRAGNIPPEIQKFIKERQIIKRIAKGLGTQIDDIIFRITQGKFSQEEIDRANRRMGVHPYEDGCNNFYEHGFLMTAAAIHLAHTTELAKQAGAMFNQTEAWVKARIR